MPTTAPAPSTTGAPSTPRSMRRSYASCTRSSATNVRISVVMTSRTSMERGTGSTYRCQHGRQVVRDVASYQSPIWSGPAGETVNMGCARGGVDDVHAGGEERGDDAGEDIAGPGRRQPGIAGGDHPDVAGGIGHHRGR